jgi:hypothetical protein
MVLSRVGKLTAGSAVRVGIEPGLVKWQSWDLSLIALWIGKQVRSHERVRDSWALEEPSDGRIQLRCAPQWTPGPDVELWPLEGF